MSEVVDFRKKADKGGGDDGFGELVFTLYRYENGHVVQTNHPDSGAEDVGYRRRLLRLLFDTITEEAAALQKMTGEDDDILCALVSIYGDGKISRWSSGAISTIEQAQWIQRELHWVADVTFSDLMSELPANRNDQRETDRDQDN